MSTINNNENNGKVKIVQKRTVQANRSEVKAESRAVNPEVVPVKAAPRSFQPDSKASKKKSGTSPILVLGLIALIFAGFANFINNRGGSLSNGVQTVQTPTTVPAPAPQVDETAMRKEKLRGMISDAESRLNQNKQRQLEEFKAELERLTADDLSAARGNIEPSVAILTSLTSCVKLTYKMAKDKVSGSNDTQTAIDEVLGSRITNHCVNANREVEALLGRFQQQAIAGSNEYRTELMQILQKPEFSEKPDLRALNVHLRDMVQAGGDVRAIAISSSIATVSAGFDTICAVAARSLIYEVLSAVVAKVAQSVGAAGISAVADGPLPIGDVIGVGLLVGGGIWSAYGLYQARKVMPDKLRTGLNEALNRYHNTLKSQSVEQAVKIQNTLSDKDRALTQSMLNQI